MISYKQAHTDEELYQILALQQSNLPKNLSAEEIKSQGFLTVEHDFNLLQKMNDVFPHTIAIDGDRVIAYALSMHPQFGDKIEVLKSMFTKIKNAYRGEDFIVMGQICVSKAYRGQGIFRGLYQSMQKFTNNFFSAIITEVDTKNSRSIQAHQAVGFHEIHRYTADGKEWSLIVLE